MPGRHDSRASDIITSMNDPSPGRRIVVTIPTTVSTGCPELDLVWARYAGLVVHRPGIAIPDTDSDLTWHAFLGHSIDMQGFRAAEFAGVDALTRSAPRFVSLRE